MKEIIAITGPSGAGKSTLGNLLEARCGVVVPFHCTTRGKRNDDKPNFYRYFTHEEYAERYANAEFFISSGDGTEIKKENGNFYGVLKQDCIDAFEQSDIIKRIKIAIELNEKYRKALEKLVDITILTDIYDIEETYKTATRSLNLNNGRNEDGESR